MRTQLVGLHRTPDQVLCAALHSQLLQRGDRWAVSPRLVCLQSGCSSDCLHGVWMRRRGKNQQRRES
ncbi:hypothetical protein NQZ68_001508 [Dissostichus eleginoides]|nr:hypothetical protein NQZ68_001508 [Dissostichus eleginoides]